MNEWFLLMSFLVLLVLALCIVLYPLRPFRMRTLLWCPILCVLVAVGYGLWGAWPAWTHHHQEQEKQRRAEALLKTVHDPEELIEKLKAQLKKQPSSVRGWYLLGRLYASQNRWKDACDAFAVAYQKQPDDEQVAVNYVHSLWPFHHQSFDQHSRELLTKILKNNPLQPDALGMRAMDAYARHDYQQAIDDWQRLLKIAPPQSNDAKAIRKAIAKAEEKQSKASPSYQSF